MTDVAFYHLTLSKFSEVLPSMLGRTLDAQKRAVIRCRDSAQVEAIDAALWNVEPPPWLPHGSKDHAAEQPIWVTCHDDNPNRASYLFLVDALETEDFSLFERVFFLFDGNDKAQVERARRLVSQSREQGYSVSYWQQDGRKWKQTLRFEGH